VRDSAQHSVSGHEIKQLERVSSRVGQAVGEAVIRALQKKKKKKKKQAGSPTSAQAQPLLLA
jgi:hypothetical protein